MWVTTYPCHFAKRLVRTESQSCVPITSPSLHISTQARTWFNLCKMYSNDRFSEEKLLGEEVLADDRDIPSHCLRRRWKHQTYLWGFQLTCFLVSLSILSITFFYRNTAQRCNCQDHMPMYSPALEAVRNTGHFQRFDGSFSTPNTFKGTPSPDIDAAWANITYKNGICASSAANDISANRGRRRHQHI